MKELRLVFLQKMSCEIGKIQSLLRFLVFSECGNSLTERQVPIEDILKQTKFFEHVETRILIKKN